MSAAPAASADKPFPWRWLAVVLLLTLLIRGAVLYLQRDNLNGDVDNYREIANNLLHSGRFAQGETQREKFRLEWHRALNGIKSDKHVRALNDTAHRPPLYPVLLSYIALGVDEVPNLNIALLHLALGLATTALTFVICEAWCDCTRISSFAATVVACDPILLNQQSLVMTETLATFLAVLALWQLQRLSRRPDWWNAGLGGAAIGLATLCRPTFMPWLTLVLLSVVVSGFFAGRGWRSITLEITLLAAGMLSMLSPWIYRNMQVMGKPIATTTHGGFTFYLGNNREFFAYLKNNRSMEAPWDSFGFNEEFETRFSFFFPANWDKVNDPPREVLRSQAAYKFASDDIFSEPGMFVWACVYRIRQLWSPLPYKLSADESRGRMLLRYATAAWYLGVYALAAVGIWRLRGELLRPPWIWGVLLCLTFTVVHTFYWSNLRMRAPLMPFVALVAAAGAGSLLPKAKSPGISAVAK